MTTPDPQPTDPPPPAGEPAAAPLDRGPYEVIRARLSTQAADLQGRMERLNEARREVFGAIPTELLATERITTANNCTPRDITAVGDRFVLGFNVHLGLKSETELSDVFAVYAFRDLAFHEQPLDLIGSEAFVSDFRQVYRYYRNTRFLRFHAAPPHLYFLFQTGKSLSDVKAFKWTVRDGSLEYVDNRSEHDLKLPPQHDFLWTRTHRDLHRPGRHPHISIEDTLFVETVGGDLTIKIEDNTDDGAGIYREAVEDPDQTLDDAEIFYALVGNIILLRIRPFRENTFRYLAFNRRTQTVQRIDSIGQSCVLLPEDHGLIFANGYFLQTGEFRTFESSLNDLQFERRIPAGNGEDHFYVFYSPSTGQFVLLPYNMIQQQAQPPLQCHGFSIFDNGRMVVFRSDPQPQKHHALQIWQTPFVAEGRNPAVRTDSLLYRIGNRDIVRGLAECQEVLTLCAKDDAWEGLYLELVRRTTNLLDAHYWLGEPAAMEPATALRQIRETAQAAISEFEKVTRIRSRNRGQFAETRQSVETVLRQASIQRYSRIDDFVAVLAALRKSRGQLVSLRELKYIDPAAVEALEKPVADQTQTLSLACIAFLARPEALQPWQERVQTHRAAIPAVTTALEAGKLDEQLVRESGELQMLIDIVSNLKIDDTLRRTQIIDAISSIYTGINQARAELKNHSRGLKSQEGAAEFASQLKLLGQTVINFLDACETPAQCGESLTRMMVQIEEVEGRFAEFDEFVVQLAEKRSEIQSAFDSRRLQLTESRNRRAAHIVTAAERILAGIRNRLAGLESIDAIHSFFAADLMVEKVRDLIGQLQKLDETVKVDDLQSRLKTCREEAARQLLDRRELFVGGQNVIRFGQHQFTVNTGPLELTTLRHEGQLWFHLTGTRFMEPVASPELDAFHDLWDQEVVSENPSVYRGEYLAWLLIGPAIQAGAHPDAAALAEMPPDRLLEHIRHFAAPRWRESYLKGVHDHDARLILSALLQIQTHSPLLRFDGSVRGLVLLFDHLTREAGENGTEPQFPEVAGLRQQIRSVAAAEKQTGSRQGRERLVAAVAGQLALFRQSHPLFPAAGLRDAAELFFESVAADRKYASAAALALASAAGSGMAGGSLPDPAVAHWAGRVETARDWISASVADKETTPDAGTLDEAAALLALPETARSACTLLEGSGRMELEGLLGDHPLVQGGRYQLDFAGFFRRIDAFSSQAIPRFEAFHRLKSGLLAARREELKLAGMQARVLTSFVRNRLVHEIYLPLIGANLAKQIGTAGEQKRTDLMGMLLLISPPGYGKTTLMEYVANRLGITFVKISGPALGNRTTSLDPADAPNAAAREEIVRLNLALEMGDNVMICVDDIQHCNPEFLQKFISLCDATRQIEGVWRGRTRTYDLRGRKVCVVMAGNPYTESGGKFHIPDMLANRADTYNLGDVIGQNRESFELSYLENAVTSNPVLARLATAHRDDVQTLIRLAAGDDSAGTTLEGGFSADEIGEITDVLKKLIRIRSVLLKINRQYIDSAAQADAYRSEPPFRLQGSYRDMNKLAERVLPVQNDAEIEQLILDHYTNQAQTLATGAEAGLLKFRELLGILTPAESERWSGIRQTFRRNLVLGAAGSDNAAAQVIAQIATLGEGLHEIRRAVDQGIGSWVGESEKSRSDPLRQLTLTSLGGAAAELVRSNAALEEIRSALTALAEASALRARTPAPIEIKNSVPSVFLEIIRYQHQTIEQWLSPLSKMAETLPPAKELAKTARKVSRNYRKIIDELERSASGPEPPAETPPPPPTGNP